mmetsp:Transcript_102730/g.257591  ORF Transcript_102730/g.257591 Transcript_102730/m.257591 type:complete len:201 (-) Transcript_102730:2172-2774(-)
MNKLTGGAPILLPATTRVGPCHNLLLFRSKPAAMVRRPTHAADTAAWEPSAQLSFPQQPHPSGSLDLCAAISCGSRLTCHVGGSVHNCCPSSHRSEQLIVSIQCRLWRHERPSLGRGHCAAGDAEGSPELCWLLALLRDCECAHTLLKGLQPPHVLAHSFAHSLVIGYLRPQPQLKAGALLHDPAEARIQEWPSWICRHE